MKKKGEKEKKDRRGRGDPETFYVRITRTTIRNPFGTRSRCLVESLANGWRIKDGHFEKINIIKRLFYARANEEECTRIA